MSDKLEFCRHYNGLESLRNKDACCGAGVAYSTFGPSALRRPCNSNIEWAAVRAKAGIQEPTCDKRSFPTQEERDQKDAEFAATMKRTITGIQIASKWRVKGKPSSDRHEVVECPECKGKLHLSQSKYNGHVHGACETPNCISWME